MSLVHHFQLTLRNGFGQFDVAIQHIAAVEVDQTHDALELLGAD